MNDKDSNGWFNNTSGLYREPRDSFEASRQIEQRGNLVHGNDVHGNAVDHLGRPIYPVFQSSGSTGSSGGVATFFEWILLAGFCIASIVGIVAFIVFAVGTMPHRNDSRFQTFDEIIETEQLPPSSGATTVDAEDLKRLDSQLNWIWLRARPGDRRGGMSAVSMLKKACIGPCRIPSSAAMMPYLRYVAPGRSKEFLSVACQVDPDNELWKRAKVLSTARGCHILNYDEIIRESDTILEGSYRSDRNMWLKRSGVFGFIVLALSLLSTVMVRNKIKS